MELVDRAKECLEESGIIIYEDGTIEPMPSVSFVTAILSLEDEFDIEFPDEYLNFEIMQDLKHLGEAIQAILTDQTGSLKIEAAKGGENNEEIS